MSHAVEDQCSKDDLRLPLSLSLSHSHIHTLAMTSVENSKKLSYDPINGPHRPIYTNTNTKAHPHTHIVG